MALQNPVNQLLLFRRVGLGARVTIIDKNLDRLRQLDDDRVYLVGPEGLLHCLRAENGALLWKKDTSEEFGVVPNFFGVGSTPIVEGDLLIALIGGSPPNSPNIMSGEIRGNGSGIVAFDKRTGEVKYKITDELASYSSPTIATVNGRRCKNADGSWEFVG